jgi:hypothetical protein
MTGKRKAAVRHIPQAQFAEWAIEAGYQSPEDQDKFQRGLEFRLRIFRENVEAPSAPKIRKQVGAVVKAAESLRAALAGLHDVPAGCMITDPKWPWLKVSGRMQVKDLEKILERVVNVARQIDDEGEGKNKTPKRIPGQPLERDDARSIHVETLACDLIRCYRDRIGEFKLGERVRAAGTGHRYHSAAYLWLAKILETAITPKLSPSAISTAAERASANRDSLATLLAAEDAALAEHEADKGRA